MKTFGKAQFLILGRFSILLSLSGCGGTQLECDSLETRNSVVKIIADDSNNALVNYAANNSGAVAVMMGNAMEADRLKIFETAKRGAVYKLGDTIHMASRERATHAVTCSVALDVTVGDTTAQKEVVFRVEQTMDGKRFVSVDPFLF
jgi:hypothetical protein